MAWNDTICNTRKNYSDTFERTHVCTLTSVGNIIFCSRKCDRKRITSIANSATRCNAPSPFVVAVHFHYCALKRAETENSKNSILSYWCISCLSEIWKAYICADTNFIVLPAARVKIVCRESLQWNVRCIEFQLINILQASFYLSQCKTLPFTIEIRIML